MGDQPTIKVFVEQTGETFDFPSPENLRAWTQKVVNDWQWVLVQGPYQNSINQSFRNFSNQLDQVTNEWMQNRSNETIVKNLSQRITAIIAQFFAPPSILSPGSAAAAFVNSVRPKRGDAAAAGAYALLVRATPQANFPHPEFFRGFFEAFLFKNDIDWSAQAYQSVLENLKKTYTENITKQDERAGELEMRNKTLNESFDATLTEKKEALETLHAGQTAAFQSIIEKHETDLKALIETYDQKLALQKPVAYWETKEKYHGRLSKIFAVASSAASVILLGGMGFLIHWIFGDLKSGQNPEHWQIGILAAAAFFAIWFLRILLRLFFSHIHLASDAAERRTMILTYLALAREGADVAPDDRKLILQHIFRSASDGLVKDDATPPSIFEILTRSK